MRILIILIIFLSACGARKVQKAHSKQLEKASSNVTVKTEAEKSVSTIDLSKIVKSNTDQSKVFETEDNSITADSAEIDTKTGKVKLKGNVKFNQKKAKQTNQDKKAETVQAKNISQKSDEALNADSSSQTSALSEKTDDAKFIESQGTVFYKPWFWILLALIGFGLWIGIKHIK